jgi:hypothetical protein
MTNRLALVLVIVVVALLAADGLLNGGAASLFVARKLTVLVDYIAFWR